MIDSHAHYDDKAFDEDREQMISTVFKSGIRKVINIGASMKSCRETIKLAETYEQIYAAIGVHPSDTAELTEEDMEWLKEKSAHKKVVAIGEIGLDYYWPEPDREIQKRWFRRQLSLAREVGLPVVIHSRDAFADTISIMKECKAGEIPGVIHCYSYSKESAREFLDMGYSFGIGGVLTFKNAKKLKEAVAYIPMDRILLETDCPYLAPEPNRGKRNSSLYIPYIVQVMAQIKGITEEEVVRITSGNTERLFHI